MRFAGCIAGRITQGQVKVRSDGDQIYFESRGKYEGAAMRYFFHGVLRGDEMSGELGLGEYGQGQVEGQESWMSSREEKMKSANRDSRAAPRATPKATMSRRDVSAAELWLRV